MVLSLYIRVAYRYGRYIFGNEAAAMSKERRVG